MQLHDIWFVIIAFLWTGYFFLEGFDFGIGVLTKLLARNRSEKRVLINTIGPVWDGNEVWLLSAGGATFAAFPRGMPPCSAPSTCRCFSSSSRLSSAGAAS